MLGDLFGNSDLIMAGGWIIVLIMALTFVMWMMILDRYVYLWRDRGRAVSRKFALWQQYSSPDPLNNKRLRAALTGQFLEDSRRWIGTIQVITAVLPLLGLLGTVTGMIKTFDVLTAFGTGNIRGMAEGISQALITTMAGLIAALTGIYFANDLEERIATEADHLAGRFNEGFADRGDGR
jgi:biopolymer transport protein ExbB